MGWDYGTGMRFDRQIERFQLLVAARGDLYVPPRELSARIRPIKLADDYESFSSSAVREAILRGDPWRHMVPDAVAEWIEREGLYRGDEGE